MTQEQQDKIKAIIDFKRNFIDSYETEKQAEKTKPQLRAFAQLLAYVAEFDSEWEADWDDKNQEKWYVYFNIHTNKWDSSFSYTYKGIEVYMSEQCARYLAEKLNSGEVIL